jgi:hypothetical protein
LPGSKKAAFINGFWFSAVYLDIFFLIKLWIRFNGKDNTQILHFM